MSQYYFSQDYLSLTLVIPIILITLIDKKMPLYVNNTISLLAFIFIYLFQSPYFDLWILMACTILILSYNLSIDVNKIIDEHNIRMNRHERMVFKRSFHKVFKPFQFKEFFNFGEFKKTRHDKNFIREGEPFTSIYYFPKIPKFERVVLKNKDMVLSYLNDGCWIEFVFNLSSGWDKWLISLSIEAHTQDVEYYKWDITSMENLFMFSDNYELVNSILILWVKYLAVTVTRLNDHISCSYKAVAGDTNFKADALPLCKIILFIVNMSLDRYLSERGKSIEEAIVKEDVTEIDVLPAEGEESEGKGASLDAASL